MCVCDLGDDNHAGLVAVLLRHLRRRLLSQFSKVSVLHVLYVIYVVYVLYV